MLISGFDLAIDIKEGLFQNIYKQIAFYILKYGDTNDNYDNSFSTSFSEGYVLKSKIDSKLVTISF